MARMNWTKAFKQSRIAKGGFEQGSEFGDIIDKARRAAAIENFKLASANFVPPEKPNPKKGFSNKAPIKQITETKKRPKKPTTSEMKAKREADRARQAEKNALGKIVSTRLERDLSAVARQGLIVAARANFKPDWSVPVADPNEKRPRKKNKREALPELGGKE